MTETSEQLAKLPLDGWHRARDGRMVPFAGYEMPVQYEGIMAEHLWTREHAGLFDVSHMGQLLFHGSGLDRALELERGRGAQRLLRVHFAEVVVGPRPAQQRLGVGDGQVGRELLRREPRDVGLLLEAGRREGDVEQTARRHQLAQPEPPAVDLGAEVRREDVARRRAGTGHGPVGEDLGLVVFIAIVGVNAGAGLISQLTGTVALYIFIVGFIVTTVPPVLVWAIGYHWMKINPAVLMGGVAGARSHSGPAREAAKEIGSSVPWIGFPVGYAISGVLLTVFGYLAMVMSQ